MFKTCFECLVGTNNNFANNDSYGTSLNGRTQTTMEQGNENKFLLPRPLKVNDQIKIKGNISEKAGMIDFKLIYGSNINNIVYIMQIDFTNKMILYGNGHNQPTQEGFEDLDLFSDSEFSLILDTKDFEGQVLMHLGISNNVFEEIPLHNNDKLEYIEYITLSKNVNVTELTFMFS